jgi:hypothetical protein
MTQEVEYSVRVDGEEVTKITMTEAESSNQFERDKIRKTLAKKLGIPQHYIRLLNQQKRKGARYVFTRGA